MQSKTTSSVLPKLGRAALLLTSLTLAACVAQAGQVSTPDLSAVYGASNFGGKPVAIHWLTPGASIVDANLTTIKSFDELLSLAFMSPDASPVVDAFFVDKITGCDGVTGGNFVGCSILSSNVFAVDSSFAAGASGALAIAHELGHTMGLEHVASGANLMNPALGSAALTSAQVNMILGSSKVQIAPDGSRYIEIRPIAVLASAVPEPETYALMLAGLMLVSAVARRAGRGTTSAR